MRPYVPMQKLKASTDVTPDVSKLSKNSIIPMNTSDSAGNTRSAAWILNNSPSTFQQRIFTVDIDSRAARTRERDVDSVLPTSILVFVRLVIKIR